MRIIYVYQAAMHCEACCEPIVKILEESGAVDYGDSDSFPQSVPVMQCESDTPQHCDSCGCFLENPLTPDGFAYVREELRRNTGRPDVLETWRNFYQLESVDG